MALHLIPLQVVNTGREPGGSPQPGGGKLLISCPHVLSPNWGGKQFLTHSNVESYASVFVPLSFFLVPWAVSDAPSCSGLFSGTYWVKLMSRKVCTDLWRTSTDAALALGGQACQVEGSVFLILFYILIVLKPG